MGGGGRWTTARQTTETPCLALPCLPLPLPCPAPDCIAPSRHLGGPADPVAQKRCGDRLPRLSLPCPAVHTRPSRAEPNRVEPSRVDPSRTEPSRSEPSAAQPSPAQPSPSLAKPKLKPSQGPSRHLAWPAMTSAKKPSGDSRALPCLALPSPGHWPAGPVGLVTAGSASWPR